MNPMSERQLVRLLDSTATARLGDLQADSMDDNTLDLVAVWLAEVSAEATLLGSVGEVPTTEPEPTD